MFIDSHAITVSRAGSPPLHFADLSIRAGESVLLLGPSGAGKTTLLSVLAGLLRPTEGRVLIDGRDIYALTPRERDRLRGRHFGFVFQTLHLLPSLTLRQNIALAAAMAHMKPEEGRLDGLLQILNLSDKAQRRPEHLSQGEQQRAAIARAVLLRPRIIIADEPTSALDDANAQTVITLLEQQAKDSGAVLLIATHDNRITGRFEHIIRLEHQTVKEAA